MEITKIKGSDSTLPISINNGHKEVWECSFKRLQTCEKYKDKQEMDSNKLRHLRKCSLEFLCIKDTYSSTILLSRRNSLNFGRWFWIICLQHTYKPTEIRCIWYFCDGLHESGPLSLSLLPCSFKGSPEMCTISRNTMIRTIIGIHGGPTTSYVVRLSICYWNALPKNTRDIWYCTLQREISFFISHVRLQWIIFF